MVLTVYGSLVNNIAWVDLVPDFCQRYLKDTSVLLNSSIAVIQTCISGLHGGRSVWFIHSAVEVF